jgi:2-hydroxy-3-keto-5-methylthiopentenyl-1-phosphate phosphatase
MNSDFSLTLTKQELIKLITESYAEGFDKGGKTSHDLLKKGKSDMDNVNMRNDFIKSKLLELKFGEK